jgi:iron complex transport system substrate-binding protein
MTRSVPFRMGALAASALATAILLTGCTATDAAPSPSSPSEAASAPSLLPPAEGTTSYPLVLETPFGDTELAERPERIAIVTDATVDTDALVALGGIPVFAPSTVERNPWLPDDAVASIETLWESSADADVSVESIAAAKPDLIVNLAANGTFDQTRFDRLSTIAPVLYAATGELTWQEIVRAIGDAIDLPALAEERVSEAEGSIDAVVEAHPEFEGRTATHIIVYEEEYGAYYESSPGSESAALFETLGFVLPEAAERFAGEDSISGELIGLIDADFLLVSTFGDGSEEYLTQSELYKAVPAVAEGRAVINDAVDENDTNNFAWGLSQQSVLSLPWLVDPQADYADATHG